MTEFERVQEVFVAAVALPTAARAAFVHSRCGEDRELIEAVDRLLRADTECDGFLADPPEEAIPIGGSRIGKFTVVRQIGEGGMGVVYLARQSEPERLVALKILPPGRSASGLLRRFAAESSLLARLQHAGIAQVFETGAHAGANGDQPFFVMEFVDGKPLNEFSESKGLDIRKRLELAAKVCDAVHHAHQRGIIHRDLKPGNILVTDEGQPKVLDFGVARLLEAEEPITSIHEAGGQIIGTIQYMAPEQLAGDSGATDARNDVFSLGVVIFELLAGQLPHDVGRRPLPEAVRLMLEREPRRLSGISPALRGEIETIVAKAMEKEKDRRYASVSELAADIRHYLADEPIAARPPGVTYLVRKFAKRHRGLVSGVMIAVVSLVASVVVMTIAWAEARREAKNAEQKTRETEESKSRADGANVVAQEQRQQAMRAEERERRIGRALANSYVELGQNLMSMGDAKGMRALADLMRPMVKVAPLSTAPQIQIDFCVNTASLYAELSMFAAAHELLDEAESALSTTESEMRKNEIAIRLARTKLLLAEGKIREAYDQALLTRGLFGPVDAWLLAPYDTANLDHLATALISLDRPGEALPYLESLRMKDRVQSLSRPTLDQALTLSKMANCLDQLDRDDEAQQRHDEAKAMLARLPKTDSMERIQVLINRARGHRKHNRTKSALWCYRQALAMCRRAYPPNHHVTASCIGNVAHCLIDLQQVDQATPMAKEALDMTRRVFPPDHADVAKCLDTLAHCRLAAGRAEEALKKFQESLDMRRRLFPDGHHEIAYSLNQIAACYANLNRFDDAIRACRTAIDLQQRLLPKDDRSILETELLLASFLVDSGQFEDAELILNGRLEELERGEKPSAAVAELICKTAARFIEARSAQDSAGRWQGKETPMRSRISRLCPTTQPAVSPATKE